MCNYKTWYQDEEKGYVIQCLQCNKFQLGFGMLCINFSTSDFQRFSDQVGHALQTTPAQVSRNSKSIMLRTDHSSINMILSPRELEDLHHILESADNEIRAESLLNCFKLTE